MSNFPLRIPDYKLAKLKYIAEKNIRSVNKEIEYLVTEHIEEYEMKYGEIKVENNNE